MSRASETSTGSDAGRSVQLGDVQPAGSRHRGLRSAVAFAGDAVVVGRADGCAVAFDPGTLAELWSTEGEGSVVTVVDLGCRDEQGAGGGGDQGVGGGGERGATEGDGPGANAAVAVGERSARGAVRVLDARTGEQRWSHETVGDVGDPERDTRFFLPFVVDAVAHPDVGRAFAGETTPGPRGLYVAARRYERRDGGRAFESVVYGFDPDGTERWRYETDASPISLDLAGDRLAVAYNRCPGSHGDGLVVLDAATGDQRWRWDPPATGERRIGDVCLYPPAAGGTCPPSGDAAGGSRSGVPSGTETGDEVGAVVTSHADYRGYGLEAGGDVRWTADLATPVRRDGDTVYAYPNHVHATAEGVAFVTGNTYPADGRETDARHPLAHSIAGYAGGERRWTDSVGGFANAIASDGPTIALPSAQAFRERDAQTHALGVFDVADGRRRSLSTEGVVTAAALSTDYVAALEEPVRYHDEGAVRGDYRLHVLDR